MEKLGRGHGRLDRSPSGKVSQPGRKHHQLTGLRCQWQDQGLFFVDGASCARARRAA